jgi:23S rRNA (cytidine1920-2'-O)/16S rRNA (cytidine1409-2'-O)-methyltransferase
VKERADQVILKRGLAESRQKAQALIMAGLVFADDMRIEKPGQKLDPDQQLVLKERMRYVSRGGLKLQEALSRFPVSIEQKIAADLGASTGGFTDCLLQHGAGHVYAVDVDIKQFDWNLSKDPRVTLIQKNARYLEGSDFPDAVEIVTMDLSFISILKVLPAVKRFLISGHLIALVKPQFEVGKEQVGKRGIVKDLNLHQKVLIQICEGASELGFQCHDVHRPDTKGQKGNQEYLVLFDLGKKKADQPVLNMVKEAVWNEKD